MLKKGCWPDRSILLLKFVLLVSPIALELVVDCWQHKQTLSYRCQSELCNFCNFILSWLGIVNTIHLVLVTELVERQLIKTFPALLLNETCVHWNIILMKTLAAAFLWSWLSWTQLISDCLMYTLLVPVLLATENSKGCAWFDVIMRIIRLLVSLRHSNYPHSSYW